MGYQTFPEFMHNDEVSGFWIFNKPQLYGGIACTGLVLLITGTLFHLALFLSVIISLAIGGMGGFAAGLKYKGVSGYIYVLKWIMYYFRILVMRQTAIYAANLSYDSTVERQDSSRVVVNSAQTSLPRVDRKLP